MLRAVWKAHKKRAHDMSKRDSGALLYAVWKARAKACLWYESGFRSVAVKRKLQAEICIRNSRICAAVDRERSSVLFGDRAGDSEPEPCAVRLVRDERVEQIRKVFLWDARTVVADMNGYSAIV